MGKKRENEEQKGEELWKKEVEENKIGEEEMMKEVSRRKGGYEEKKRMRKGEYKERSGEGKERR